MTPRVNPDKTPKWFNRAEELALAEWKRTFDFQRDDVFLRNPAAERKVERFIKEVVLPTARKALKPTHFRLLGDKPGRKQDRPPDEFGNSVRLCLEDPDCPSPSSSWFTRLEVNCTTQGVSLFTDYLCIYLPRTTDFNRLVDTLSETSDVGFPAQLSVVQDPSGASEFHIEFKHTAMPGAGLCGHLPITEKLERKLIAHCDFAEIAGEIAQHPTEVMLFRRLIHQVNEAFEI